MMNGMEPFTEEDRPELERVLGILDDIVSEVGPNYVYPQFIRLDEEVNPNRRIGCWYLDDEGNCSCIVGRVLDKLGWTKEELTIIEGASPSTGFNSPPSKDTYPEAQEMLSTKLRQATLQLLNMVQIQQDTNVSWYIAVRNAHRFIDLYLGPAPVE